MKQKPAPCPTFIAAIALLVLLAALQGVLPARQHSDLENRPLAGFTAPTASGVRSGRWMQSMEDAVEDQLPGRDAWIALQSLWDAVLLRNERNGILLGRDGWLFERADRLDLRTAIGNLQRIEAFAADLPVPVSMMIVPTSAAVYPEKLPGGYRTDDQVAILAQLTGHAPSVAFHNIFQGAETNQPDSPLYYRTDHHWTMAGATVAYERLTDAWGLVRPDALLQTVRRDGFYGSYYARAPSPLIQGEPFAFDIPAKITLEVEGEPVWGLYDPDRIEERDKYAALLWGNHGHITLRSATGMGRLLVIKDSYANALLPLLAQHFARIDAVDPRYYTGDLQVLVEETEAEQVLCLYGLTTLLTDRSLLLLGIH